jgi:hypothetical protein
MNWSQRLRLFEVIIAGIVPLKLCLADIQLELFTRSSSVEVFAALEEAAPVRQSPLDEIALQVRGWDAQTSTAQDVNGEDTGSVSTHGIKITDDQYDPKLSENLQDFIFSRFQRLASGE